MAAVTSGAARRGHADRKAAQKEKLRDALLNNQRKLTAKFKSWDEDGSGSIDKQEFQKAIPRFGAEMGIPMLCEISAEDLGNLFDVLDEDGSGSIELGELKTLLKDEQPISNIAIVNKLHGVVQVLNSTTLQTILYIAFVAVFQTLTETMRNPKHEYYFDKMLGDTILENHFDSSHNYFSDIRRIADVWEWGNTVLLSGMLANAGPFGEVGRPGGLSAPGARNDEVWPDGDASFHYDGATPYTVPELVEFMDQFDWTEGIYVRQARVAPTESSECRTEQLSGACYPELDAEYGRPASEDTETFGYNWTDRAAAPASPYMWWDSERLGARPSGQMSAALTSMRTQPTSGYVALAIPFFATEFLPEQRGLCDPAAAEVRWYRDVTANRTHHAGEGRFWCVRLTPNGVDCRQLCDPTDIGAVAQAATRAGRSTGVVRAAVEVWWNDLKRGHWIDDRTRVVTVTLQLRCNNIGLRTRATLMFEFTALGAVLPSFDIESLVEDVGRHWAQGIFMNVAMGMCCLFIFLEGVECYASGPLSYLSDIWNVMDWLNFLNFFAVYSTLYNLRIYADNRPCAELCAEVGYVDDWQVMGESRDAKMYLSLCVCIQLLKLIKFTNVLVPKMSLMTEVLGRAKADLVFFGVVFAISMFAFSNLFYVQLGPMMTDFHDQVASFVSLARALFGDFDIDDIMSNSKGYTNAVFMLIYLFVAVFILLSMFLAILGEAQAAVRDQQEDAKESGTAPAEYGVFTEAVDRWEEARAIFSMSKKPALRRLSSWMGTDKPEEAPTVVAATAAIRDAIVASDGRTPVSALKESVDESLASLRHEIAVISEQVQTLQGRGQPVESDVEQVISRMEMLRKFEATMAARLSGLDTQVSKRLRADEKAWGKVAGEVRRVRRTSPVGGGVAAVAAAAAGRAHLEARIGSAAASGGGGGGGGGGGRPPAAAAASGGRPAAPGQPSARDIYPSLQSAAEPTRTGSGTQPKEGSRRRRKKPSDPQQTQPQRQQQTPLDA